EHFLAVIGQQGDLGAFMAVDADAALARADGLDAAYASTGVVGPLHGLPIAFKVTTNISGMVTTFGSQLLADSPVETEEDPVATNAKTARAVSVSKASIPKVALTFHSDISSPSQARNPGTPELTAVDSSGGASTAIAAGMLPVAPATDCGGSNRIPAAATG